MTGDLESMNKKMDNLKITSRTLVEMQDMMGAVTKVQKAIEKQADEIHKTMKVISQIQAGLSELQTMTPIFPEILREIAAERRITRETIDRSTDKVVRNLNRISQRLDLNESAVRIIAEILPKKSPLIWYADPNNNSQPGFRLWTLDHSPQSLRLSPNVNLGGIEFASVSLGGSYDNIMTKRHVAEDVDEDIRERKSQRATDLSPYFGIARRGNDLEELREFMPLAVGDIFPDDVPRECQVEATRIARTLAQEYRYMILDQIRKHEAYTLPELHVLEDMERAMLALHAEKMSVNFGFFMVRTLDDVDLPYKLRIHITR
jgi:hypothetical protein